VSLSGRARRLRGIQKRVENQEAHDRKRASASRYQGVAHKVYARNDATPISFSINPTTVAAGVGLIRHSLAMTPAAAQGRWAIKRRRPPGHCCAEVICPPAKQRRS
jgi:hypothetical protein